MRTRLGASTFTAVGLGLLLARPAIALVANCGDTVVLNGGTEVLENDILACNQDPALTVTGPGTFDMDGHTISCEDEITQNGLLVDGEKAKVRNGLVEDCLTGVTVTGTKHRIERMVSESHEDDGFENFASKSKFRDNTASDNDDDGFDNNGDGDGSTFERNTATDNSDTGFENSGEKTKLRFNTATGNGEHGFENNSAGARSRYGNNTAADNSENGFVNEADNCAFLSNLAPDNGISGFLNDIGATDNTYKKNLALGSGSSDDIRDENGAGCDNNKWKDNTFGSSNFACIQ